MGTGNVKLGKNATHFCSYKDFNGNLKLMVKEERSS